MSRYLDEVVKFIKEKGYNVIRISEVLPGGETETAEIVSASRSQDIYSGAKAFTMTAIGMLCDDGLLSVDEKIIDIFADVLPEGIDPRWEKATVEHALLHKAGLPHGFMDIDTANTMEFGKDHLKTLFSVPLAYTPGEGRIYTDAAYYLLSRVVTAKSGIKLDDFMWQRMFADMGFMEAAWSKCPMGYPIGATGLFVHTSDMVKLAELYRDKGVYHGKRFLSEDWVNTVYEKEYCFEWDTTHTIFFKGGMAGQKIMFNAVNGRAVAMQSYGADSDVVLKFTADFKD